MKLLLDECLPRSTVRHLRNAGFEAIHIGDMGSATTSDAQILDMGRSQGAVVVTLDADFHALLALSGSAGPFVIRVRIEGLRGVDLGALLVREIAACKADLDEGALVTVTESGIRFRHLPLVR